MISKRASWKKYGGLWECNGGSILAGETSLEGILRELKEELGISFTEKDAIFLKEVKRDKKVPDFKDLWIFQKNISINENTLEKLNSLKVFYPVLISSFVDWIKKYWNLTDRSDSNLKNKVVFDMADYKDFYKAIIYYISGMTDNFAISCYNEIIGF